jgi:alkylation response protein AidB-like acyl-CoA dehydrogenase
MELTQQQLTDQARFRAFAEAEIAPHADRFDREERMSPELIRQIAQQGYLGATLPTSHGGGGMDMVTFGLLNEEFGRGCSSVRSLLTVHGMVSHVLLRWGSRQHKQELLPQLAAGELIGAFALSEPNVGSDAKSVETVAEPHGDSYVLNGCKKWITYGQIADIFLVFAQCEDKPTAFLVEANRPGVSVKPINGLLGCRGSMLAEVQFNGCAIPAENLVCRVGFGFSHVAATALDLGRYSVACGCVGIGQACLDASLRYSSERRQSGVYLREHQLIQQMITDMIANVQAARLLCHHAGELKDKNDLRAVMDTLIAKYFASTIASRAANDAVQIHGANGYSSDYPVQRYLRDAKAMEIIEGSSQIQQITIAKYGYREYRP